MKVKTQAKKNKSRTKSKDEEEVIEINDASIINQSIKLDKPKMKSENIENNSSEDTTTTNKRKNNKKMKANEDLIEIMDIEVPEIVNEKKNTRQRKNLKDKDTKKDSKDIKDNKEKKKQKGKSCGKILCKEKSSLNKKKKTKQETNINLDESESGSGSDIQVMSDAKIGTSRSRNKSKSPIKKGINKKKNSSLNKTNVKVVKKNKKKEKEVQQIELSENEESIKEKEKEKENEKEKDSKKPKDKKKKDNIDLNSSSCSNKNKKISKNSISKDAKSIIKTRTKDETKMKTFLGKKRKPDKKIEKIETPKKNSLNSVRENKINNAESQNKKPPSITEKDSRTKTPLKKNKSFDLTTLNLENNEQKSNNENIDKKMAIIDKLISKYGIEKVLDSLFKSKLDQQNILESPLKELAKYCPNTILNFILCKMIYSHFNSRMKEIEDEIHAQKRSVSEIKSSHKENSNKKENAPNEKPTSKNSKKSNNSCLSLKEKEKKKEKEKQKELEDSLIQIEIEDIDYMENYEKNEDKNCFIKNKSGIWNIEEKKSNKKNTCIGSHYHKNVDGNIYKYQVYRLDGKGNAIFKCFDDNCNGMGIYGLDSMKFEVTKQHNLKYSEHEFVTNYDKVTDDVLKELTLKKMSNAQVFKENRERNVKYY